MLFCVFFEYSFAKIISQIFEEAVERRTLKKPT